MYKMCCDTNSDRPFLKDVSLKSEFSSLELEAFQDGGEKHVGVFASPSPTQNR